MKYDVDYPTMAAEDKLSLLRAHVQGHAASKTAHPLTITVALIKEYKVGIPNFWLFTTFLPILLTTCFTKASLPNLWSGVS
jgi:hypothetical protein